MSYYYIYYPRAQQINLLLLSCFFYYYFVLYLHLFFLCVRVVCKYRSTIKKNLRNQFYVLFAVFFFFFLISFYVIFYTCAHPFHLSFEENNELGYSTNVLSFNSTIRTFLKYVFSPIKTRRKLILFYDFTKIYSACTSAKFNQWGSVRRPVNMCFK